MSEEKIFELYNKYAHAHIREAKATKSKDYSQEYKVHYEMLELRREISKELENILVK